MNEAEFNRVSNAVLSAMLDVLERADEEGTLEVEFQMGIMTITLDGGHQFIINKHAPSQQIWLSSPLSGGLHFSFDASNKEWALADGRRLDQVLSAELHKLVGIEVVF